MRARANGALSATAPRHAEIIEPAADFALAPAISQAQQCRRMRGGGRAAGAEREGARVATKQHTGKEPITIKKYANRRLYNTATSTYVTLEDLSDMVKEGQDFLVYDAKSGEDITRSVLTQIIFEEESKGQHLLPIRFLRQLIGFYGDSMQTLVPSYLEVSLETLIREQERFRKQMAETWVGDPFTTIEQQAKQNLAMFEKAMSMFTPFAGRTADRTDAAPRDSEPRRTDKAASSEELDVLRSQLDSMQKKLDDLAKKS
jgi:polyhydroxyalkanoate synthesis repressor PhaR